MILRLNKWHKVRGQVSKIYSNKIINPKINNLKGLNNNSLIKKKEKVIKQTLKQRKRRNNYKNFSNAKKNI